MKTAKIAYLLVFVMLFGGLSPALAAPAGAAEDARFFVQTTKGFWRGALGVRNEFEDGFTTEASGLQMQLAKLMGVTVIPVQRLNILPEEEVVLPDDAADAADPAARGGNKPNKPTPEPEPRVTPSMQVPWGVSMLYGVYPDSDASPSGGASVSVAILDTGIDASHPDLVRRIVDCRDFSHRRSPMIEGECNDRNGHGTHVAGIIAADGGEDGLGIFGVAPQASLKAYKVCGKSGSCWSDDIANAIYTAADTDTQIINMSLGSDYFSSLIADAVAYARSKGVLVVAAAGNDGPYDESIDYPAALTDVVAVGALDSEYQVAEWSSRGINESTELGVIEDGDVEVAAPGVNVESTFKGSDYAILSGTSMASPHIAGLAARIWKFEGEKIDQVQATRTALQVSASIYEDWVGGPGEDNATGLGIPMILATPSE